MNNFVIIFLLSSVTLVSWLQNSQAGSPLSTESSDGEDNVTTFIKVQPNEVKDSFDPFETFYFLTNSWVENTLPNNDKEIVNNTNATLNQKSNDEIPTVEDNLSFEDVANQNNSTANYKEPKPTTGPVINTEPQTTAPTILNLSSSLSSEMKKKKQRKKKKPSSIRMESIIEQQSSIRSPQFSFKENLRKVELLIQKVIQEKRVPPIKVQFSLSPTEFMDFHKAFTTLVSQYPSSVTWSIENKGRQNLETDNPAFLLELSLASRTNEKEKVEIKSLYQISQEDEQKVDWPSVFDVAARSKFTPEDLAFKRSIKVRLLDLQGNSEKKILEQFAQFLEQGLSKDLNPFHILGITYNTENTGSMLGSFLKKVNETHIGWSSRGVSFDPQSGSLYLCLENTHRKFLDLHGKRLILNGHDGKSVNEACQETKDYLIQAYENFEEQVTVFTGRGNHANFNGEKGVLKGAFKDWVQDPCLAPLIANYCLVGGEGGYKVSFVQICHLNLHTNQKNNLAYIRKTIAEMIQHGQKRLHITLNVEKGNPTDNREFNLMVSIYADLKKNNEQLAQSLLPISFESTPRNMRIIFNKEHPKASCFTFTDNHGSKSVYGTIR